MLCLCDQQSYKPLWLAKSTVFKRIMHHSHSSLKVDLLYTYKENKRKTKEYRRHTVNSRHILNLRALRPSLSGEVELLVISFDRVASSFSNFSCLFCISLVFQHSLQELLLLLNKSSYSHFRHPSFPQRCALHWVPRASASCTRVKQWGTTKWSNAITRRWVQLILRGLFIFRVTRGKRLEGTIIKTLIGTILPSCSDQLPGYNPGPVVIGQLWGHLICSKPWSPSYTSCSIHFRWSRLFFLICRLLSFV